MAKPHMIELPRKRYRTIWISDVHLGTRPCRIDALLELIDHVECETLYLVGDIIDLEALRKRWYWPESHNDFIRRVLELAGANTRVVFVPGNHDEGFREFAGLSFGGVHVELESIHTLADGRRMLILHGDRFDEVIRKPRAVVAVLDWLYEVLLGWNGRLNWLRRRAGRRYWSLAAWVKERVATIKRHVSTFEEELARYARERGCPVVLAGHIHRPELREIDGVLYCNDGDWIESCTAIVEHEDGELELLHVEADHFVPSHAESEPAAPAPAPRPDIATLVQLARAVCEPAAGQTRSAFERMSAAAHADGATQPATPRPPNRWTKSPNPKPGNEKKGVRPL